VVRFDRESTSDLSDALISKMISFVKSNRSKFDAAIISDYGKGIITKEIAGAVIGAFNAMGKCVSADPKVKNFRLYRKVTTITPNQYEAGDSIGMEIKDEADVVAAGAKIIKTLGCASVLITRGEHGMSLIEKGRKPLHIPTVAKEVFDVTGAGDTVISAMTLAVAGGASLAEGAMISNHAAGIVVGKLGTATASRDELEAALRSSI
jgi:rfaE bifunctional protein kinase chain/domain